MELKLNKPQIEDKRNSKSKLSQVNRLATVLGMGAFNGSVSLAALAGLFKFENSFMLAVLLMAGPGAILTALLFDGVMKERMLSALLAGIIATIIVVLAAGIGTKALSFFNLNILKIAGGVAIFLIGLLIMGLKINEKLPMAIIFLGLILAAFWRN